MICKICGESGHFTQGCSSTLGANRKSQDFFERVPARDPQVKALFTERVISKIEREILAKGVDAVHKIKNEGDKKVGSGSGFSMTRSRSPEGRSPVSSSVSSRLGRSDSQRYRRVPSSKGCRGGWIYMN